MDTCVYGYVCGWVSGEEIVTCDVEGVINVAAQIIKRCSRSAQSSHREAGSGIFSVYESALPMRCGSNAHAVLSYTTSYNGAVYTCMATLTLPLITHLCPLRTEPLSSSITPNACINAQRSQLPTACKNTEPHSMPYLH